MFGAKIVSFPSLLFFFSDLGFDTTKMVSELHFGQHISLWLGLILPCVDLFLYSPLLWTDNVVHGHVFHTFLQSLVAGSGPGAPWSPGDGAACAACASAQPGEQLETGLT